MSHHFLPVNEILPGLKAQSNLQYSTNIRVELGLLTSVGLDQRDLVHLAKQERV